MKRKKQNILKFKSSTADKSDNNLSKIELKENEKELEVGYKANYEYYLRQQDEWKYADSME